MDWVIIAFGFSTHEKRLPLVAFGAWQGVEMGLDLALIRARQHHLSPTDEQCYQAKSARIFTHPEMVKAVEWKSS